MANDQSCERVREVLAMVEAAHAASNKAFQQAIEALHVLSSESDAGGKLEQEEPPSVIEVDDVAW